VETGQLAHDVVARFGDEAVGEEGFAGDGV